MADEERKIFVDDDWKASAKQEKERMAEEAESARQQSEQLPDPTFAELVNLVVTPALAGLGLMQGPNGQPMPPNPDLAKHFIDVLQMLDEKTKGNLDEQEKQLLDQVLYELRMRYVEMTTGGGGGPAQGGQAPGGGPDLNISGA
jgi:hypothetical protein